MFKKRRIIYAIPILQHLPFLKLNYVREIFKRCCWFPVDNFKVHWSTALCFSGNLVLIKNFHLILCLNGIFILKYRKTFINFVWYAKNILLHVKKGMQDNCLTFWKGSNCVPVMLNLHRNFRKKITLK